ncbi:hypothetical protein GA707_13155 [Nostocoides sp. F2B08]|nr:hypothetical protein GA707_13155 [Tetrasphaera sp. F2B08]
MVRSPRHPPHRRHRQGDRGRGRRGRARSARRRRCPHPVRGPHARPPRAPSPGRTSAAAGRSCS